jgi:hypothetical protein
MPTKSIRRVASRYKPSSAAAARLPKSPYSCYVAQTKDGLLVKNKMFRHVSNSMFFPLHNWVEAGMKGFVWQFQSSLTKGQILEKFRMYGATAVMINTLKKSHVFK